MNDSQRYAFVFLSLLLAIICSLHLFSPEATGGQRQYKGRPGRGGELHVAMSHKPLHMNPAVHSGIFTGIPGTQLFAYLLRIDRNWKYHPYLARKWDVSGDGLRVTFHIKEGALFHDEKPITSEDVAFSIMAVKEHHPFSHMLRAVDGVETPDPLTAVVRLNKPHPALMLTAASPMLPIMPKHIYGDGKDLKNHPSNWRVIGSGPFCLEEATDNEIVLTAFQDFFEPGRPYLGRIVINIVPSDAFRFGFETGNYHLVGFSETVADNLYLERLGHLHVDYQGYSGIGPLRWLAFNMKKPPFDDIRVRRAVCYAIDRRFIAEKFDKKKLKVVTGPISSDSPFYSEDVEKYDLNVKQANRLLDEAGFPRASKGIRFSTTLEILSNQMEYVKLAEYLKSDLLVKTGINIKIERSESFTQWADRVSKGEFTMTIDTLFNWGDPVIGVHRTYSSRNIRQGVIWSNTQGYINPRVDQLMDMAGMEMNFEKRRDLYREFQQIIAKDIPVYGLYELPYATIHHKDLMGVHESIWGIMFPFSEIYWNE